MARLKRLPEDVDFNKVSLIYGEMDDGNYIALDIDDEGKIRVSEPKLTQDITYVTAGNGIGEIATIKEYPTGAEVGSPARLTTFTYDVKKKFIKIEITETTV